MRQFIFSGKQTLKSSLLFLFIPISLYSQNIPKFISKTNKVETEALVSKKPNRYIRTESKVYDQKDGTLNCFSWKYGIMGSYIGENGLIARDIDNDGKIEIVCTAGKGFLEGLYWYILEYNPTTNVYDMTWISDYHNLTWPSIEEPVGYVNAFDINNDNVFEIVAGYFTGDIIIYNGATMEEKALLNLDTDVIEYITYGDADNDGQNEIIIINEGKTYICNTEPFYLEYTLNYGSKHCLIINVDNDTEQEIVYSNGDIIEFDGQSVQFQWNFLENSFYSLPKIFSSDLDNDNKDEIIITHNGKIQVYDADLQQLKYEYDSPERSIGLAKDLDQDGTVDLVCSGNYNDSIYSVNPITGDIQWTFNRKDITGTGSGFIGILGYEAIDTDNDGNLELLWSQGHYTTGRDNFYIYDLETFTPDWISKDICGPFYSTEITDLDNDGVKEIIAASYSGDSYYNNGIISIFDSETHNIKWQSDNTFPGFGNITSLEIFNIDDDEQKEIIIGCDDYSKGIISVVDGLTYEVQSHFSFNQDSLRNIYALVVGDVENDGNLEYLVYTHYDINTTEAALALVNVSDYFVKWKFELEENSLQANVLLENIDNDQNKELLFCNGKLYVFDGITFDYYTNDEYEYISMCLFDIDNDGVKEIISGTTTGELVVLTTSNLEIKTVYDLVDTAIVAVVVKDIMEGDEPEFIFTSDGRLNIFSPPESLMQTQSFGTEAGALDGLSVDDCNNDGIYEIVMGTNYTVVVLNDSCYECHDFNIDLLSDDVSCDPGNDGVVEVMASGGEIPYHYIWNTGDTTLTIDNLPTGMYDVKVTENHGCFKEGSIEVVQAELVTQQSSTINGCLPDYTGSANVQIIKGHPPYSFLWNTGDTVSQINQLMPGEYSVLVSDNKNCKEIKNFVIEQDSMDFILTSQNILCANDSTGYAEINIVYGIPPFNILWSNNTTINSILDVPAGNYFVKVTDSLNCSKQLDFELTEPPPIIVNGTTTPDSPETPNCEGSISLNISGGLPPYSVEWLGTSYYDTFLQKLNSGVYTAVIYDSNNCTDTTTYTVDKDFSSLNDVLVYPNPVINDLFIYFNNFRDIDVTIKLSDVYGETIIDKEVQIGQYETVEIDMTFFATSTYFLKIIYNNEVKTWKIIHK